MKSLGLDRASYNQGYNAQFSFLVAEEYQPTLTSRGPGAVAKDERNGNEMIAAVRRLTPKECARLQGFPDDWLDIGEWVDKNGKKHKDADSPKFKALGNSLCLCWWYWLWRNICFQLNTDGIEKPTLGSLFDGIGGFPRVHEMINGKGTALWASEIEEFPIAVTKIHFPEDERKEKET